jgi:hypothetical protein
MVLPIEQRDVAIDLSKTSPRHHDQFAELDARNCGVFARNPAGAGLRRFGSCAKVTFVVPL